MIADVINKVITEYTLYVKRLKKGYKDDYSHILNMIAFLEVFEELDNNKFIYKYLINS